MMMVANDMTGDEEDSHKTILTNEGFKVTANLRGLGENNSVRTTRQRSLGRSAGQ